jgi:hypothetical protein
MRSSWALGYWAIALRGFPLPTVHCQSGHATWHFNDVFSQREFPEASRPAFVLEAVGVVARAEQKSTPTGSHFAIRSTIR